MSALPIRLKWYKDSKGYRTIDYGKYGTTIIGNGGKLIQIQPMQNDAAFLAFVKVSTQPQLVQFVHHFGLLERPSYERSSGKITVDATTLKMIESRPTIFGEDVDDHLATARKFGEILRWMSRKGRAPDALSNWITERMLDEKLGEISLEFASSRGFQMCLQVHSLLNGMLMQLATKFSGQTKFRKCQLCGVLFEVGSKNGRRSQATFCSPEHKVLFHSRRRSKRHRE
jgi:hypothetical protein